MNSIDEKLQQITNKQWAILFTISSAINVPGFVATQSLLLGLILASQVGMALHGWYGAYIDNQYGHLEMIE